MVEYLSPNHGPRPDGVGVAFLVIHYTGLPTAAIALDRLTQPGSGVSAHYTIDEDGSLYAHVAEERRAWHAGRGAWRGCRDLNSASIGIELVNPGHEWGYRPFPEAQIAALERLAPGIMARHGISPDRVLAHSDLACDRKQDPGELFPWCRLAAAGIGVWPNVAAEDRSSALGQTANDDATLLHAWGYDTAGYGVPLCLTAFRRRFHPEALSVVPDLASEPEDAAARHESRARLRALLRAWPRNAVTSALGALLLCCVGPGASVALAAEPQRTQPGHLSTPPVPVSPPPVVPQPRQPLRSHEVMKSDKPWRKAGQLDRKLSDACARGQFQEWKPLHYRAHFKDGVLGVAKGNGINLKDPGHLADAAATYLFFAGDSTWCQVLKLKDDAAPSR